MFGQIKNEILKKPKNNTEQKKKTIAIKYKISGLRTSGIGRNPRGEQWIQNFMEQMLFVVYNENN